MWNVNVIDEIFNKFVDVKAIYHIYFFIPLEKGMEFMYPFVHCRFFVRIFLLDFMLHQHCKGYMATFSFTGGGKPKVPLRA